MTRNPLEFPYQPERETPTGLARVFNRAKTFQEDEIDQLVETALKNKSQLFRVPETLRDSVDFILGPFYIRIAMDKLNGGQIYVYPRISEKAKKKISLPADSYWSGASYRGLIFVVNKEFYEKDIEQIIRQSMAYYNYLQVLGDLQTENRTIVISRDHKSGIHLRHVGGSYEKVLEFRKNNKRLGVQDNDRDTLEVLINQTQSLGRIPNVENSALVDNYKSRIAWEVLKGLAPELDKLLMAGQENIEKIETISTAEEVSSTTNETYFQEIKRAIKLKGSNNYVFLNVRFDVNNYDIDFSFQLSGEVGDFGVIMLAKQWENVMQGFKEQFDQAYLQQAQQMVKDFDYLFPLNRAHSSIYSLVHPVLKESPCFSPEKWKGMARDGCRNKNKPFYDLYQEITANVEKLQQYLHSSIGERKLIGRPEEFFTMEAILMVGPENLREFLQTQCVPKSYFNQKNQFPHFLKILEAQYRALYRTGQWTLDDLYELDEDDAAKQFPVADLLALEMTREFELNNDFEQFINLMKNAYAHLEHPNVEKLIKIGEIALFNFLRSWDNKNLFSERGAFAIEKLYDLLNIVPVDRRGPDFWDNLEMLNKLMAEIWLEGKKDKAIIGRREIRIQILDQTIELLGADPDSLLKLSQSSEMFYKFFRPLLLSEKETVAFLYDWFDWVPQWCDKDPQSPQYQNYRNLQHRIWDMMVLDELHNPASKGNYVLAINLRTQKPPDRINPSPDFSACVARTKEFHDQLDWQAKYNHDGYRDGWTPEQVQANLEILCQTIRNYEAQKKQLFGEDLSAMEETIINSESHRLMTVMIKDLLTALPIYTKQYWTNDDLEQLKQVINKIKELPGNWLKYFSSYDQVKGISHGFDYFQSIFSKSVKNVTEDYLYISPMGMLRLEHCLQLGVIISENNLLEHIDFNVKHPINVKHPKVVDFLNVHLRNLLLQNVSLPFEFYQKALRALPIIRQVNGNIDVAQYRQLLKLMATDIFSKIDLASDQESDFNSWYAENFGALTGWQTMNAELGIDVKQIFYLIYNEKISERRIKKTLEDPGGWWQYLQTVYQSEDGISDEIFDQLVGTFLKKSLDENIVRESFVRLRNFYVRIADEFISRVTQILLADSKISLLPPEEILQSGQIKNTDLTPADRKRVIAYLQTEEFLVALPTFTEGINYYLNPEIKEAVEQSIVRYYQEGNVEILSDPNNFILWGNVNSLGAFSKKQWREMCLPSCRELVVKLLQNPDLDPLWFDSVKRFFQANNFQDKELNSKLGWPSLGSWLDLINVLKQENKHPEFVKYLLTQVPALIFSGSSSETELGVFTRIIDPELRAVIFDALLRTEKLSFSHCQKYFNYDELLEVGKKHFPQKDFITGLSALDETNLHLMLSIEKNMNFLLNASGLGAGRFVSEIRMADSREHEPFLSEYLNQFLFGFQLYNKLMQGEKLVELLGREMANKFWQSEFVQILVKEVRTDVFARIIDQLVEKMRVKPFNTVIGDFVSETQDFVNRLPEPSERHLLALCKIETLLIK